MNIIVLIGENSSGKTSTALKIIENFETKYNNLLVLESECKPNADVYNTFQELFDSLFDVDLFNQRKGNDVVDKALEAASGLLLGPISKFMSGSNENRISKQDMYVAVKKKLQDLSKVHKLLVFIDNMNFIDNPSKSLLKYLLQELKNEDVIFLLTSNSKGIIDSVVKVDYDIFFLEKLKKDEQRSFLQENFNLSDNVAEWIIKWVSNSDSVYPGFLADIVKNLHRQNFLVKDNLRYVFSNEFDEENPKIPDNIRESVLQSLENVKEYHYLIFAAAVMGKEFDLEVLSKSFDLSLVKITDIMNDINKKTDLVYDVLNKDNIFSFKSQMVLETIRKLIGYTSDSFIQKKAPQIIRYYHRTIAEGMEKCGYSPLLTANHLYASGKSVCKKAIKYQLEAAKHCKNVYEFNEADTYLKKAEILSTVFPEMNEEIKKSKLLIEASKKFVTGDINLEFIDSLIREVDSGSHDELKISAARLAYTAGKYDIKFFDKCGQIAKKYLTTSDNILTKAEGYHFMALSLDNKTENIKTKNELFKKAINLSKTDKALFSQIATSYANFLSFGTREEKDKAKELFFESMKIKENLLARDLPGLARAYGGLGRLFLFQEPCECKLAIEYFNKDLEISLEIKDKFGISNMYSLLGMAYRMNNDCKTAIYYYDKSIELLHNKIDIFASIFGKIACGDSKSIKKAKEFVKKYGQPPIFTYNFLNPEIIKELNLK